MDYKDEINELLEYIIIDLNPNVDPDDYPDMYDVEGFRQEAKEHLIKLIKEA